MLFKYVKREFAEALISRGNIRIGTLDEFRRYDADDLARRDAEEGRKSVRKPIPHTVLDGGPDDEAKREAMARELGFVVPPGSSRVEFGHNVVTNRIESADAYIYSASEIFDQALLADFSADVAVVVTNPDAFFRAVTRRLAERVTAARIERCVYAPREHTIGEVPDVHPCWLKDPTFAYQREVRAAWQSSATAPSPLILDCPELSLFCDIYVEGGSVPSGTVFRERDISSATIELDGLDFEGCTFSECHFIFRGGNFRLTHSSMKNCSWSLEGPAGNTLLLLRHLHQSRPPEAPSWVIELLEAGGPNIK